MMLSRRRHALLVEGLEQRAAPLGASARFRLYSLTPPPADEFVIVHDFAPDEIDNNLGYRVVTELLPLLTAHRHHTDSGYGEQDLFERAVGDIVRSMAGNERAAWRLFYANTLNATQASAGLGAASDAPDHRASDFIGLFGAIYRHALELIRALPAEGAPPTVLDVATCFGFFPLLLARAAGESLGEVAGCDLNPALMGFANDFVAHEPALAARFGVADILAEDIERELAPLPARFDAVTALHLLEHLDLDQTEAALANLWRLTARRLIVAVPLEAEPDPRYGHRQVFDRERLLALGRTLGGRQTYCEYHGGWLVIDRPRPARDRRGSSASPK
ncbi:MAG: class I SAM-dependent methyltransferase [Candidatus Competibacter sp.]|nr:class I SAM-dependent methyltransferase [Candidatus Competibacter sp.]